MGILQGLAVLFLVSAGLSSVLLAIALQFDEETFNKAGIKGRKSVPGIIRSSRLFSLAENPKMQVLYLFSLIFVVFAYAAIVLLVIQLITTLFF